MGNKNGVVEFFLKLSFGESQLLSGALNTLTTPTLVIVIFLRLEACSRKDIILVATTLLNKPAPVCQVFLFLPGNRHGLWAGLVEVSQDREVAQERFQSLREIPGS